MGNNYKKKEDLKKTIQKLLKIEGQASGLGFKAFHQYFKEIIEPERLKELNQIMAQCGWPLKIEELKPMEWYPAGLVAAYLLVLQQILFWDEKKIEELGETEPKISLIERLLGRYFLSSQKTYQRAPEQWRKHFNIGIVETPEFNSKEKYWIVRIKDFKLHPIHCVYLKGFLKTMSRLVIRGKNFKCEEIKCVFKGDSYHEFKTSWE